MVNPVDEPERLMTHEREVTTHDSRLENTPEHRCLDSEDDMDADTDSETADIHEAHEVSPRSVSSTHRSQRSLITARSDASIHRLSQSSMGTASHCGPFSPAPLSLIHLPPQTAPPSASDSTKSEPSNDVRIPHLTASYSFEYTAICLNRSDCQWISGEDFTVTSI